MLFKACNLYHYSPKKQQQNHPITNPTPHYPTSKNSSTSKTYYIYIQDIYLHHIHRLFLNYWQPICTAMRVIPAASPLLPDTDLQGKLGSLKNISIHMTICLTLHIFLYINFKDCEKGKRKKKKHHTHKQLCWVTHTTTKSSPKVGKTSAPRAGTNFQTYTWGCSHPC